MDIENTEYVSADLLRSDLLSIPIYYDWVIPRIPQMQYFRREPCVIRWIEAPLEAFVKGRTRALCSYYLDALFA